MWKMIATWAPSISGVGQAQGAMNEGACALDGVELALRVCEEDENCGAVAYGGEPNEDGVVQVDAGIMDGRDFSIGSVAGIVNFLHPISVARMVMEKTGHVLLVGEGAERFALQNGFEQTELLTEKNRLNYLEWKKNRKNAGGHDTVGIVVRDLEGNLAAGTTTSGIAYKMAGRVGDSPIAGAGFYADNRIGGAATTGLGEDMIRTLAAYQAVRGIAEGLTAQRAAERAVRGINESLRACGRKVGAISIVCMDRDGNLGAAANLDTFAYTSAGSDHQARVTPVVRLEGTYDEHGI